MSSCPVQAWCPYPLACHKHRGCIVKCEGSLVKTFKEVKNHEVLPCGCEMATGVDWMGNEAFLFQPCRPDCEYYAYVVEQSKEMGQPTFPAFGTIEGEK